VNARLKQFVPAGHTGLLLMGATSSGGGCEIGIGANSAGIVELLISKRTMMGTEHYVYSVNRGRTLTGATESKTELVINSVNEEGREILKISLGGRDGIREIELIQETSGFFGTKLKSLVKCSV
jgi:hypothetical protein